MYHPNVNIRTDTDTITVTRSSDEASIRALHGTSRALLNNMVVGVSTGFTVVLEIDGVGYRAEMNGKNLVLYVGYSAPVTVEPVEGVSFDVDTKTQQVKNARFSRGAADPGVRSDDSI